MNNSLWDTQPKLLFYRYLGYLILLIPAFIFRDYTPANELKYISIANEALHNGTWFSFLNHGVIYADKPPLYFQLIMLSKLITGEYYMGLIGLFSLFPAIGVIKIMDSWLLSEKKSFNPLVANLMLFTSTMFLGAALVVRMDMLMLFFIVLALRTFYKIYQNKHNKADKILFAVYLFLALYTKGPLGLLIPLFSAVVFLISKKQLRKIKCFFSLPSTLVFIALCLSWFALVYAEEGRGYLFNLLFKQTVGRGVNSFHHKEPLWFYFPRMLWSFAPWSLFFIVMLYEGVRNKMFKTDLERFFLVIICTSIVLLSLISSKLDIYLLPIYPFVVYLCVIVLARSVNKKIMLVALAIPAFILTFLAPVVFLCSDQVPLLKELPIAASLAVVVLSISSLISLILLGNKRLINGICAMGLGILLFVFVAAFAMPSCNKYFGLAGMASSCCSIVKENPSVTFVSYKFIEAENVDVLVGRNVEEVQNVEELDSLALTKKPYILFIDNRDVADDCKLATWLLDKTPQWSFANHSWYIIGDITN